MSQESDNLMRMLPTDYRMGRDGPAVRSYIAIPPLEYAQLSPEASLPNLDRFIPTAADYKKEMERQTKNPQGDGATRLLYAAVADLEAELWRVRRGMVDKAADIGGRSVMELKGYIDALEDAMSKEFPNSTSDIMERAERAAKTTRRLIILDDLMGDDKPSR